MQKIKKIHQVDPEKLCHRHTDRQTDRLMDRQTELILQDQFHKDGRLIMFFKNSKIKFSYIIWLDCEPYGKNQYKKKEYSQKSSMFEEFKNNYS